MEEADTVALLGFRFNPTDEELMYYLKGMVGSAPLPITISQVDLYMFEPWDLPAKATFGDREWYFFCRREAPQNRATRSGYWKATGTDKPVMTGTQEVGWKKILVYFLGKKPNGIKTNWMMHEYRLADDKPSSKSHKRLDDWVLCRIYKKAQQPLDQDHIHQVMGSIPETSSMPVVGHHKFLEIDQSLYDELMTDAMIPNLGSSASEAALHLQLLHSPKMTIPTLCWNDDGDGTSFGFFSEEINKSASGGQNPQEYQQPNAIRGELIDNNHTQEQQVEECSEHQHTQEQQVEECSVATSDSKRKDKGKRKSGLHLSLELLKPHFGKKLKDTAEELGIGRSTIKRACRDYGIDRWPSKEKHKKSPSLFQRESGKDSQLEANPETDHVNVPEAEKVITKVKYGEDIIKFELCLSLGVSKLFEEVASKLKLKLGTFKLKYLDEDDDEILLTSDDDLQLCRKSQITMDKTLYPTIYSMISSVNTIAFFLAVFRFLASILFSINAMVCLDQGLQIAELSEVH